MAYTTNIQLGSSGVLNPSENGNFYLAFNDNDYSSNTGSYVFNLYLSGILIGSKIVPGSYNNWQPAFSLVRGYNYTYTSSGIVSNGETGWSPDGWVGHIGSSVEDEYGGATQTIRISESKPNMGEYSTVVNQGFIYNPFDTYARVILNASGPTVVDNALTLNGVGLGLLNYNSSTFAQNILIPRVEGSGAGAPPGGYIRWLMRNTNGGYGGGSFAITFQSLGGDEFLAPDQTAYSLVGQFVGVSSPSICLSIGEYSVVNPNNYTGSGYTPTSGYRPTEVTGFSGQLSMSIENTGSYCSSGIANKIVEFSINSYYPESGELDLDFSFEENNTSYAKYLSYTKDNSYFTRYTGYIDASGFYPNTIITGYLPIYQELSGIIPIYVTGLDSGIQICYTFGTTGSGIIGSGTGILQKYYGQALTGITGGSGYIEYIPYTFQSGTGVVTQYISGFDPQMSVYKDGQLIANNDDWENGFYYSQIVGQNLSLSQVQSADIFDIVGGSGFNISISQSPKYSPSDAFIRKNSTTLKLLQDSGYRYPTLSSQLAAWASYDVTSGTNSKNVIAYAIEIIDDLFLSGQEVLNTGNARNVPPYLFSTGSDIRSEYIGYCVINSSEDCEDKEINDVTICYTGDPNGPGYNSFVSGVLKKFKNSAVTDYDPPGTLTVSSGVIPSYFQLWSGYIEFNTFASGDKLIFDLYPFDYTGLYQQYFNANPLYPTTGLTLTYPIDFNNPQTLVSAINTRLSGITYPVWYPYECLSGSGNQGIYISGTGLLGAQIRQLSTGDINYNNIIDFFSLRNNTGYKFNLNLTGRPIQSNNNSSALKYLLPSYISLQGSDDNSTWTNLDIRTGIEWTGISPIERTVTGIGSGIPDTITIIDIEQPFEEEVFVNETGIEGGYQNLYSFNQSGAVQLGPNCAPINFVREVSIIKPTGFPPNTIFDSKTCAPSGLSDEEGEDENEPTDASGNPLPEYTMRYLRTGWVLDSGLVGQPIEEISYNYYRIYLSGFQSENKSYQTSVNTFVVNNINLYSCVTGQIPVHTGETICGIGANYVADIQGTVMVPLSGNLVEYIELSDSGVLEINNEAALMKISGYEEGDLIKLNKKYARITSNSGTGFITDKITGTGCFTTGITDWFYNPTTYAITFESGFNTCISGSGRFSGEYIRLKPSVVNQQLAAGGFLTDTFSVSIFTGATFTGLAPVEFLVENVTGIYSYTGITGGYAALGYFELNTGISINLNGQEVDYVAGGTTGYINALGTLNYGVPQEFDVISINGQSITYNADSGNWIAPSYFSTSGQLLDIVNSDPATFLVSGYVDAGLVKFTSLISGESGNSILLNAYRGSNTGNQTPIFDSLSLTGGQNLYRKLYGTGTYQGNLSALFYKTGYYFANDATGTLTGYIPTYQGIRNFTGVWGLSTGNFFTGYYDFLSSNFTGANGHSYYNAVGGNGYAVSPLNIDVNLLFTDLFDTQSNSDVVRLTVSGSGISGISKLITGIFALTN